MKSKILSKIADKKLEKMGFKKVSESESIIHYSRENTIYKFTQIVDIGSNFEKRHYIMSYVDGKANTSRLFNDAVRLTGIETKWFLIKMMSAGLYSKLPAKYKPYPTDPSIQEIPEWVLPSNCDNT